jgi:nucleoside-diphosphate-sugar epimerase
LDVLVTGCAGFIGSRVTELLLEAGDSVFGIDDLNPAYDVTLKKWRLARLVGRARFDYATADIADPQSLARGLGARKPDAVVNLAARAGVRASVADPAAYFRTNLNGTLNLLDFCKQRGVPKFVLASTSSVYGDGQRPFRESSPADRPLSPYAASKRAAEQLSYSYHHLFGIDVTVLRYFTVYGPAGRPDMSVFRFIRWIVESEPVQINGDGSQERDFTFVDDIARGTCAGLRPLGFEILNLGNDSPVALKRIVSLIEEFTGKNASLEFGPAHPSDVRSTWADISRAGSLLGFRPSTGIESGIRRCVDWYLANREWAREVVLN